MDYFDVPLISGDGVCSDNQCPCPENKIPRGTGFLYVSSELVEKRRKFPSYFLAKANLEIERKMLEIKLGSAVFMTTQDLLPILMCEQGARLRNLDLDIASADATYWWETGLVPLRATSLAPKVSLAKRQFDGITVDEARTKASRELADKKIYDFLINRYEKTGVSQGNGNTLDQATDTARKQIPSIALNITSREILQQAEKGVFQTEGQTEEEAIRQLKSNIMHTSIICNSECLVAPKEGFLGLGKKPGKWRIQWEKDFIVKFTYVIPAIVTVRYEQ